MPKVTTPTAAEVAAGHAGTARHDRFTVTTKTADGSAGVNLRDADTTVSMSVTTADRLDVAVSQVGLGARCRVTIPDTIVSRANRFLSSLPGAVTLHRDWHTKTHGIKADGLRPVWIETSTLYRLTPDGGRWTCAVTPGDGTISTPAPTATPAAPRKRRVIVTGHGAVKVSTAAQTAPAPSKHVANRAPSIDAATGRPVAGSTEPFPTAPLGAIGQPGIDDAEAVVYRTWSGHEVKVTGNATGARVIVQINREGLVGGALTADDMTRLGTALAGWDVSVEPHPRTGAQCVVLQPGGYHAKRKYLPVAPHGTNGSGSWMKAPAAGKANAGVPGGPAAMQPPVCGAGMPSAVAAAQPSWRAATTYCTREPGHPISADAADQHTNGWVSWPDPSVTRAAAIAADEQGLAEAMDEDDVPEPTVVALDADADLPAGAHEYVPMDGLVARWETMLASMADGHPGGNWLFKGPSGSGKGDGAAWLAAKYGMAFTKVDAASITEPEGWFGTKEAKDGNTLTVSSLFVQSVTRPGVTFVDEASRAKGAIHNIFLPLLDGSRRVTNPLTGQVIERHPQNVLVLAANIGLEFSATYDLDIALTSRVQTVVFDYPPSATEQIVLRQGTKCDAETAESIVRFATEVRALAKRGSIGVPPMSTRECLMAALSAAYGLDVWAAIEQAYVLDRSAEGGEGSQQAVLRTLWATVNAPALTREDAPAADSTVCAVPECGQRVAIWGEDVAPDGSRPGRRCLSHQAVLDPVDLWLAKQAESGRRVVR